MHARAAQDRATAGAVSPPVLARVDDALALVIAEATPGPSERVELDLAGDRVLASPVVAQCDAPTCDVSAMDGYAVRSADLVADWNSLNVVGESYAGRRFTGDLAPGCAVRIFTGAPVPPGADRVVLQEDVRRADDRVLAPAPVAAKRHIRLAGSDFRAGAVLLEAGRRLGPAQLVAAAAADLAAVEVRVRPRVVVVATGDELRAPGFASHRLDAVPESVSFGVAQLARRLGASVSLRRWLPDDLLRMRDAAGEILGQADVVVVIGGASVGERDFSRAMFEGQDFSLLFSKVAMRPGKPVWFGKAHGARVLGLPGNPTAAMVTARLFLAPLLAGLVGLDPRSALRWRRASLADGVEGTGQWESFLGGRRENGAARIFSTRDSSGQGALAALDLLIRRPAQAPPLAAGQGVQVLDFDPQSPEE